LTLAKEPHAPRITKFAKTTRIAHYTFRFSTVPFHLRAQRDVYSITH
jgi:hypothetical protein